MTSMLRALRIALAISLTVSVALFVAWSRQWPLVGDASLIHYITFLIEQGKAPYRELSDMNMPGTFLIEMAGMKLFGGGAAGWRGFDFALLLAACGAFAVMTRRAGWFAAVFAGTLFALVHGRDGLAQAGQRDLTMAVLLVLSTAALFLAIERRSAAWLVGFGVLAGAALTIKPTTLPLSLAQLAIAAWVLRKRSTAVWAGGGMLVGPLAALGFLVQEHAVAAFWAGLRGIVPYYASLGHKPLGYLLAHCLSPLQALVAIWVLVLLLARPELDWRRGLLLCGVGFGLLSYVIQARGFPYHRYPLLAFLLPLLALDCTESMEAVTAPGARAKTAGWVSVATLCVGGFFLGPQSAAQIHRFRWWETDFNTTLAANLDRLGGASLSGQIQCIDWISGCENTLYNLRLVQQTGLLEDFLLFGPGNVPVIADARQQFREAAFAHPPRVIVVSSWLHIDGPGDYRKLDQWPELEEFLARDYTLDTEWKPARTQRWWSREETEPGYRIYVRR
jgi:hypothetical protein